MAALFLLGMMSAGLWMCWSARADAAAQKSKKEPPAEPLDLNAATVEQLQKLPGVGPTTAKAIVRFREKSGPFRRVEDLLAIRGITKARLANLRPYVMVKAGSKEAGKLSNNLQDASSDLCPRLIASGAPRRAGPA